MKRSRTLLVAAAAAVTVVACDSMKEAFTAHVDVVARAGGKELTTERLSTMLANAGIPIQKDVATVIANLWVNYQLLATAGARNDSLNDPKLVDDAMWAMLDNAKAQRFYDQVIRKSFPAPDTTGLEQKYAQGDLLAAQHILIMLPQNGAGMSPQKQDSLKKKAEEIRKSVTSANFTEMANKYTEDPSGKGHGGSLGVFPVGPGGMVPDFENAVRALKPGEVTPGVVRTSFGFHIIRRNLLPEVHDEFIQKLKERTEQVAQKKYIDDLEAKYKLQMKPNIASKAHDVAKDPDAGLSDRTVLATSRAGDFTAARLARWVQAFPAQSGYRQQLASAPDSIATQFVRSLAGQDLIIAEADKAKIKPDSTEYNQIRGLFHQMVASASTGLHVDPKSLGDSAKSQAEKEKLGASRVEEALDQIFASHGTSYVEVPQQVVTALRKKYPARINTAGLDRALERAMAVRAASDSARAKQAEAQGGAQPVPGGLPPARFR